MILRKALIGSTLTYGLQTHGITEREQSLLDGFTRPRLRQIQNGLRPKSAHKPSDVKPITPYNDPSHPPGSINYV